jgi:hypothetical protein
MDEQGTGSGNFFSGGNRMATAAEAPDYFARSDSPQLQSPVGTLMLKILEKYPGLGFDAARAKAKELLAVSAKGKVYRSPRVFSADELAERAERLKTAFSKSAAAA